MTGNEIRRRFLEHFASREHKVLPSASLVPHGDPSTLFISAGMQPLKPYYLGLSDPPAPRLATFQKCLRTGDIDEVGKTDRHNTFFEMLGNFAPTGDYFKETAIPLAWELVMEVFEMPVDRLRVTIHPTDDEAHGIWIRQPGMTAEHVTRLEDNWWGLGAGPCGPDSEIWWDRGKEFGCGQDDCVPDHCDRFTEFWNLVFPQYDQRGPIEGTSGEAVRRGLADGSLVPLKRPAIDTGMGLERISYILQGKSNIFETDLLAPLADAVRQNSDQPTTLSERIIADHIRAATFVIGDGVMPSNEGRGYVLRRLIRRAAIHAQRAGLRRPLTDLAAMVGAEISRCPPLQESWATNLSVSIALWSKGWNSLKRSQPSTRRRSWAPMRFASTTRTVFLSSSRASWLRSVASRSTSTASASRWKSSARGRVAERLKVGPWPRTYRSRSSPAIES